MSKANSGSLRSLLAQAIDLAFLPIRVAVSPLARRAYLSTFLLFVASGLLLFLSSVAYILFYYAYVPHAAVSVPIYLQYAYDAPPASGEGGGAGGSMGPGYRSPSYPFGTALLTPALYSNQKYDVEVVLSMPRSPVNRRAGNFMVELALLAPTAGSGGGSSSSSSSTGGTPGAGGGVGVDRAAAAAVQYPGGQFGDSEPTLENEGVVVRARRPAILSYASIPVDLARKAMAMPWYALGWAHESEELEVGMLEDVEFAVPRTKKLRGSLGVPDRVRVTVESREALEVYSVRVEVRARLAGLRWLMYKHWILSFVVFTGGFFTATMGSAVAVFVGLTVRQVMKEQQGGEGTQLSIKDEPANEEWREEEEEDGLSDTPRQFPTGHGKQPLMYTGRGRRPSRDGDVQIKQEDVDAGFGVARATEADDEGDGGDEDYADAGAESFRDSGIGTGREERDAASTRRRKRTSGAGQEEGWDPKGRMPGL